MTISTVETPPVPRGTVMDAQQRIWEERGLRDAVLAGDEAAWRTLYERCSDGLYAFVHHRVGRQMSRAEEITQECWLVAVRRIGRFDPARGSFDAWLRGIAGNVLRNHRRKWRRQNDSPGREQLAVAEAKDNGRPAGELAEQIAVAMTALPGRYQQVLRAKYHEQLSVTEIAARSGESAKAIESLLSRARDAFRRAYRDLEER